MIREGREQSKLGDSESRHYHGLVADILVSKRSLLAV